jgi:Hypoxia induced protein conserved region
VYALYRAYKSMRARDSAEMNRMFRARIYAQFFTLLAVVAGGMYYKNERQQRREFDRTLDERKHQEKRDAWLRELEARDREDRGWRERHAAMEQAARDSSNHSAAAASKGTSRPGYSLETDQTQDRTARAPIEAVDEKGRGSAGVILEAVRTLVWRK